jgi:DNA primase
VVAFIGRAHPTADPTVPKYLNSPGTVLFRKSDLPYGLNPEAIGRLRAGADLAIVEGPLDARAVQAAARHVGNDLVVVAPLGTALTASQLTTLNQIAPLAQRHVLVAFDPDPAGQRAAVAAYPLLINAGVTAPRIPRLPSGLDAADLLARDGVDALVHALDQRRPLVDIVIDQLAADCPPDASAWTRVQTLDTIAPVVGAMPSAQRARQAARIARITGFDPFTVLDTIQRHVPYEPTPRGPLGLPTPPKLRSQRDRLGAAAAKIKQMQSAGTKASTYRTDKRAERDRSENFYGRDPL